MGTERAVPAHHAREYETIYILRPNAGEEAADKVSSRMVEIIDREQGKLAQVEVWGRRRLAYKIRGHSKGVFYHIRYLGYPGLVEELERNMRMLDSVIKYQSVKLKEEIDPTTVDVDPEAIQFGGVDFTDDIEEKESDIGFRDDADDDKDEEAYGLDDYEPEPLGSMRPTSRRDEDGAGEEDE